MKKRKIRDIGLRLIFGIWMLLLIGISVSAQEQSGSIKLQLPSGQTTIEMSLLTVAEYENGSYILSNPFAESGITLSNLNDAQIAQRGAAEFADYAKKNRITGVTGKADANGTLVFDGLKPALYLVMQSAGEEMYTVQAALVPIPYMSSDGAGIYDAVISPKYSFPGGAVILNKVDDAGKVIGQVTFTLQEKVLLTENTNPPQGAEIITEGGNTYFWREFATSLITNEQGQVVVTDMPVGEYRFLEVAAPEGFIVNTEPVYFSITQAGQVKQVNEIYVSAAGQASELTVVNKRTFVRVAKVDENGNPLAGAKLVVKTADGQVARSSEGAVLFSFTSAAEPTELRQLPAGNYLLSEVEAPDGYLVSADVPFTVSAEADAVNTVTMTDQREQKSEASLTVTKSLVDEKNLHLTAADATYYVALFSDAERTQRVSDVKALHFQNTAHESVTFSNLVLNQKYYVGETDEGGVLINSTVYGDGVFTPEYPGQTEITPTARRAAAEYAFDNKYLELPRGYYYGGELTITKKVLRGTEDYKTKKVFYAAVFEDAEHTKRYGDVVKLEMDGKSTTSVTVPVYIGETADSSVTYYVAETDEDGQVLASDSGLMFTVSVDKSKVTMSPEASEQTVTITNRFDENETDEPEGTAGSPASGSGSGSSPVRTGDDTPVAAVAAVMLAAAAVILILIAVRRRKRRS